VTLDRAIAGSEPSFQTVEHLQPTAFDGGGLLPPNSVPTVNMIRSRKIGDQKIEAFLEADYARAELLIESGRV
jgi:hypothetical protein